MRIRATDIVLFLLLALGAVSAFGQVPVIKTKAGDWQVNIDSLGVPTLVKIEAILDLRTGGNTPTDTPDTKWPDPPKVDLELDVVNQIGTAAKALNDPAGSNAMALVYIAAYDAYAGGKLDYEGLWAFIKEASGSALAKSGSQADWTEVRRQISVLANDRIKQHGQVKAVHSKLIASVSQGLDNSSVPVLDPKVAFEIVDANNALIKKHTKAGVTNGN